MGWLYKKSEAATTLLIIIVILFFLGWLINLNQRECKSNRDCGSEAYCGSDFSCHTYPNIQKTLVQYNLFWPAVVIGTAIVLAAWLFKESKMPKAEQNQAETKGDTKVKEEVKDIGEPYYKSNGNVKTP